MAGLGDTGPHVLMLSNALCCLPGSTSPEETQLTSGRLEQLAEKGPQWAGFQERGLATGVQELRARVESSMGEDGVACCQNMCVSERVRG